jgi:hypothetical protein
MSSSGRPFEPLPKPRRYVFKEVEVTPRRGWLLLAGAVAFSCFAAAAVLLSVCVCVCVMYLALCCTVELFDIIIVIRIWSWVLPELVVVL